MAGRARSHGAPTRIELQGSVLFTHVRVAQVWLGSEQTGPWSSQRMAADGRGDVGMYFEKGAVGTCLVLNEGRDESTALLRSLTEDLRSVSRETKPGLGRMGHPEPANIA